MIGGERLPEAGENPRQQSPRRKKRSRDLSGLHKVYDMVARFLNLTGQMENIDYTAKNFVHADLTNEEFTDLQKERGESLFGFALKAAKNAPEPAKQPDPAKLLAAMLSGKSNLVKLEIVHTLGQGDDQIAAFAGESVIISDRNQRCLEVMNRELAAGHKKLGVFYGAAHFPDMEKRLRRAGFQAHQTGMAHRLGHPERKRNRSRRRRRTRPEEFTVPLRTAASARVTNRVL